MLQEARVFNDPHLDARPQTMRYFLLRLLLIRRLCFANSHLNTRVSQSAIELAVEPPSFTVFFLYSHQSDALAFTLGYGNIQYKCSSWRTQWCELNRYTKSEEGVYDTMVRERPYPQIFEVDIKEGLKARSCTLTTTSLPKALIGALDLSVVQQG